MIALTTLPNRVRIVTETIPSVRSISFGIWVNNGGRHENPQNSGISHFLEHMFFKGTHKRTALEIADTMDAVGGQLNAFTSKEATCYFVRILDTHFDIALDVLSDMFFNSKFDPAEIDKERNVILEELNMYEDTPDDLVGELLHEKMYPGHPLGMPILGTKATIESFTQDSFLDLIKNRYTPENIVVAVAGNFDQNEIVEKITAIFGQITGQAAPLDIPSPIYTPSFATKDKDIEQVHLAMGLPGIAAGTDESYALAAVNTIFGGGMSSRIFQKIREEHGLVYSVYSYPLNYMDTGALMIYAALNPSNLQDAISLLAEEARGMLTNKINDTQLYNVKEQLKASFLLSLESTSSRMNSLGRSVLMLDRVITTDELIQKIDQVDMAQFYDICDRVFRLDQTSIALVGKNVPEIKIS